MVLGVEEPTVTQHDRNLVIAGLRTKGGRGTSAAKVTARDAAHLITAIMGSEQVKDSANTVLRYTDTVEHASFFAKAHPEEYAEQARAKYAAFKLPALDALVDGHSFIDALTTLITLAMDETFDQEIGVEPMNCRLHMTWPRTQARIDLSKSRRTNFASVQATYGRYTGWKGGRPANDPPERDGPLERGAQIYSKPIRYIGALLGDRLKNVDKLGEAELT